MSRYPLYVVSKGRSKYMVTSKSLTKMGVPHYVVVERSDLKDYDAAIKQHGLNAKLIELDQKYKEQYELCDNFGLSKSTGPGPARNFAWDHSKSNGFDAHWVMDDNIDGFYRLNKNLKVPCKSPEFWNAMADFCERYENVLMAGPNYFSFAPRKTKQPPFVHNTRIYSCNWIRNDAPFRWRGRYNEDTILSLDMLTAGWCTIQFNAFLQFKMETQKLKGGNTDEFYHAEGVTAPGAKYADTGTLNKSQMLVDVYPEVAKIVYRFSRIHHEVDYSRYKRIPLRKRSNYVPQTGVNNYGMSLIDRSSTA